MREHKVEGVMCRGGSEFETPVLTSPDKTLEDVTQQTFCHVFPPNPAR